MYEVEVPSAYKTRDPDQYQRTKSQAKRFDTGKPELDYWDQWYEAMCEVARVCRQGAAKYEVGNYLLGQTYRELVNSGRRHTGKFASYRWNDYDEESSCHHLAHAIWNLMQCLQHEMTGAKQWDNRIKPPAVPEPKPVEGMGIYGKYERFGRRRETVLTEEPATKPSWRRRVYYWLNTPKRRSRVV